MGRKANGKKERGLMVRESKLEKERRKRGGKKEKRGANRGWGGKQTEKKIERLDGEREQIRKRKKEKRGKKRKEGSK